MSSPHTREIRALQTALAGVHAAIWGYGRLTPELSWDEQQQARSAYNTHRDLRARLAGLLTDRDIEPVASSSSYRLPHEVHDAASARELAAVLEHGCARTFGTLVEHARDAELRRYAADQLQACARRERDWGRNPGALPGAPAETGAGQKRPG